MKKYALIAAGVGGGSAAAYYTLRDDGSPGGETAPLVSASASGSPSAAGSSAPAPVAEGVLASAVPEDVDVYAEVPSIRDLAMSSRDMKISKTGLTDLLQVFSLASSAVASSFEIEDGSSVVSALGSAAVAARITGDKPYGGVVIGTTDRAGLAKLLASKRFSKSGQVGDADKYKLARRASPSAQGGDAVAAGAAAVLDTLETPPEVSVVWFEKRGLLAVGTDAFLDAMAAVGEGKQKALGGVASYQAARKELGADAKVALYMPADVVGRFAKERGNAPAELEMFLSGYFKDPGPILGGIYTRDGGVLLSLHAGLDGEKLPAFPFAAPPALTLAAKLPGETLAYYAFATKSGLKGPELVKLAIDQVKKHDLSLAAEVEKGLADVEKKLGVGVAQVLDALGDQAVVALLANDKNVDLEQLKGPDFAKSFAVVYAQELANKGDAKKLVDLLEGLAMGEGSVKRGYDVTATDDGGYEGKPKSPDLPHIAVRYPGNVLFVGVGADALVKRGFEAVKDGKAPLLGGDAAHTLALSAMPKDAYGTMWFEAAPMFKMAPPELAGFGLDKYIEMSGDRRVTAAMTYGVHKDGARWRIRLDQLNGFAVLPALGIYGVRRYLVSAKTSEAKNTLGAIARGATASYEREAVGGAHAFCKSAVAVPNAVPSARKYQPSTAPGADFESGDEESGWKCLRFTITQPHYYQYGYSQGGPYKGPSVGGPDPGPSGFEAWAAGDLDGDGVTSLFTITGTVDAQGNVKRSDIFVYNESE